MIDLNGDHSLWGGEGAERALELVRVRGGVAALAWVGAAELAGGRGGDGGDQEEDGAAIHFAACESVFFLVLASLCAH